MVFGFSFVTLVLLIAFILIAMSVHEAMHAYVALRLGDRLAAEQGRISLNPLKHVDPLMTVLLPAVTLILFHVPFLAARPVPFNPERVRFNEFGAALIAVAGPVSNLLLAIVAATLLHIVSPGSFVVQALGLFVALNVTLFVFNLVPVPPLDGSRVLYAFAPETVQDFLSKIEPYGLLIIFALIFVGHFGDVLLALNNSVLSLLL